MQHRPRLSDADLLEIAQVCCFIPTEENAHLTYPVHYLIRQIYSLKKVKFESEQFPDLCQRTNELEEMAIEVLAIELELMGALTSSGLHPEMIARMCPLPDRNKKAIDLN